MSLAEIESRITEFTPAELEELQGVVAAELKRKKSTVPSPDPRSFWGSMAGTVVLSPGWDDPEPLEMWEALRDTPL